MKTKKFIKLLLKIIGGILLLPVTYILIALLLSYITVNDEEVSDEKTKMVYLNSNGVHLDVVFAANDLSDTLKKDLVFTYEDQYLSFGWGDEGFYLNTPTWGDLTFKTAVNAAFFDSPTLMHLTPYKTLGENWVKVPVTEASFKKLVNYVSNAFLLDTLQAKQLIPNQSYGPTDTFYKANGNYSLFKTCNSWVNQGFKKSGLKAAFWTPFDFGLLNKYN